MIKVASQTNEEKWINLGGEMFNSYCINSKWIKDLHAKIEIYTTRNHGRISL